MSLFSSGDFVLHSGDQTDFLIDCEALTDADLDSLARIFAARWSYGTVEGVPRGGLRFAEALRRYSDPRPDDGWSEWGHATYHEVLIADDVLTTGASMKAHRAGRDALGVVIFTRAHTWPGWVVPIFRMGMPPNSWKEGRLMRLAHTPPP